MVNTGLFYFAILNFRCVHYNTVLSPNPRPTGGFPAGGRKQQCLDLATNTWSDQQDIGAGIGPECNQFLGSRQTNVVLSSGRQVGCLLQHPRFDFRSASRSFNFLQLTSLPGKIHFVCSEIHSCGNHLTRVANSIYVDICVLCNRFGRRGALVTRSTREQSASTGPTTMVRRLKHLPLSTNRQRRHCLSLATTTIRCITTRGMLVLGSGE